jgi:L,D-transpeptidase catalytic domain/Putative peptidoglycan binding domain
VTSSPRSPWHDDERRSRSSGQRSIAPRHLPAIAAVAVVGAVVVAGAAGGLGGDSGRAGADRAPLASGSSTVVSSSTTTEPVVVTEATEAPIVKTDLSQPLGYGMAGDEVREVQQRLTDLHFFPGPIDGQFGNLTRMAVWAFEKLVLGVPSDQPTGIVTNEMWQHMQDPLVVEPLRHHSKGEATEDHTEVYLPQQVVAFFVDDQPVLISHMSSGTGDEWREVVTIDPGEYGNENGTEPITRGEIGISVTPGGVYTYDRFVDGIRDSALGSMWNPAYFNYGIAIHGALNVPTYPASHGCIRVPLKVGEVFHQYVAMGDQVFVFDGEKTPEQEGSPPPIFNRVDPDYTTTTSSTQPPTTTLRTTAVPPTTTATTAPPTTAPPPVTTLPPTTLPPTTLPPTTQPAPTTATVPVEVTTTAAASGVADPGNGGGSV